MSFTVNTVETAPEESKEILQGYIDTMGFVPNLIGVLAAAPSAVRAYKALASEFQQSSFNADELTVVWQTINHYHSCHYCVPAHAAIANMMKVEPSVTDTIIEGKSFDDAKLETLRVTTLAIVDQRGDLSDEQLADFYAADYGEQQLLEILVGAAQKLISNYTNRLAKTPVDDLFAKFIK